MSPRTAALGSGSVTLPGGLLNINTPNPFNAPGQSVQVQSGGQLVVGATDPVNGINYNINVLSLGCLTTSDAILQTLDATPGGNLNLTPGAMLGHPVYNNLSTAITPIGIAATDLSKYTYGLSTDVNSVSTGVTIGNGTPGLWGGLGGDKFSRTFGSLSDSAASQYLRALQIWIRWVGSS